MTFLVLKRIVHFVQKFRKFPLFFKEEKFSMFFGRRHFFTEINCLSLFIFTGVTFGGIYIMQLLLCPHEFTFFFFCSNDRDICSRIRIAMVICA